MTAGIDLSAAERSSKVRSRQVVVREAQSLAEARTSVL
jgi:hypothetical protein